MKKLIQTFVILACLGLKLGQEAVASIVTFECGSDPLGNGFLLAGAIRSAGPADTVLVPPCEMELFEMQYQGWPVELTASSPVIMSAGGAEVTILEGDGTFPALVVEYGARIDIQGLTFRNLTTPISNEHPNPSSVFMFKDNIVEQCASGLHATWTPDDAVVSGNLVRYNGGSGIWVYHNSGVIENNEVCYNSGGTYSAGIAGTCCEHPTVRDNHVHDNSSIGIKLGFSARMNGNLIEGNGAAGIWLSIYNRIDHNVIRSNGVGVLISDYSASWVMEVDCNDIYDNTSYNVEVTNWADGGNWDLRNNWWGTTDPGQIAAGILDCNDDPTIEGCVLFEPWATAPGCGPTAVQESSWGAIKALFRSGREPN